MASHPPPPPFDLELDAIDTMPLGDVLQRLVSRHDEAYLSAAGLVFRERLKMLIRMDRARAAWLATHAPEEPAGSTGK